MFAGRGIQWASGFSSDRYSTTAGWHQVTLWKTRRVDAEDGLNQTGKVLQHWGAKKSRMRFANTIRAGPKRTAVRSPAVSPAFRSFSCRMISQCVNGGPLDKDRHGRPEFLHRKWQKVSKQQCERRRAWKPEVFHQILISELSNTFFLFENEPELFFALFWISKHCIILVTLATCHVLQMLNEIWQKCQ